MTKNEVEAYLAKWYGRDPANPAAPSRFRGVTDDVVNGCAGYSLMHTDITGASCITFVPADVTEAKLDDVMLRAHA